MHRNAGESTKLSFGIHGLGCWALPDRCRCVFPRLILPSSCCTSTQLFLLILAQHISINRLLDKNIRVEHRHVRTLLDLRRPIPGESSEDLVFTPGKCLTPLGCQSDEFPGQCVVSASSRLISIASTSFLHGTVEASAPAIGAPIDAFLRAEGAENPVGVSNAVNQRLDVYK